MKKILNVTSEFSIGDLRAHRRLCRTVAGVSSFLMLATFSAPAFAAGTSVLGGDATLTGATRAALNTGSATDSYAQFVANAGAKSAVLDWSKFNIGAGKEMNFSGAGTTFFNLVDGAASKSQIDGIISGNGSVWVINPSGIAFGASSQVNVGGTFAAAAGNISNADALRDGTSTLPTFSSFAGEVSSASGAKFTADQVALMGKTVSAAGDFTGAKALTVAASSGAMTVDDVGGGKVSVNLGDFAASDAEVSLGDLDVGGSLSVKSAVDVFVNGKITAENGEVTIESAAANAADGGDLTIANTAEVRAQKVYLGAGTEYGIDPMLQIFNYNANGNPGDVAIEGSVVGSDGLMVGAGNGSVEIGENAVLKTEVAGAELDVEAGVATACDGNVTVRGVIQSAGAAYLSTASGGNGDGDIVISESGQVEALSDKAYFYAGQGAVDWTDYSLLESTGDVAVNGRIKAADIDVQAGYNNGFGSYGYGYGQSCAIVGDSGTLQASENVNVFGVDSVLATGVILSKDASFSSIGKVYALNPKNDFTGTLTALSGGDAIVVDANSVTVGNVVSQGGMAKVYANGGDLTVDGTVSAANDVYLAATGGKLTVQSGSTINSASDGASVKLYAQDTGKGAGIQVDGQVTAVGEGAEIAVLLASGGELGSSSGNVLVGSDAVLKATGKDGAVKVYGSAGDTVVAGTLESAGDQGTVTVSGNGNVTVSGRMTAKGEAKVYAMGTGTLSMDGVLSADGEAMLLHSGAGDVVVNGQMSAGGDASVAHLKNGTVIVNGNVLSDGATHVMSSAETGTHGDVVVNGTVKGVSDVMVSTGDGVLTVNGRVLATGEEGDAFVSAGVAADAKTGDIRINGLVSSEGKSGRAYAISGLSSNSAKGDVVFGEEGQLASGSDVGVVANRGDVRQNGATVQVLSSGRSDKVSLNAALKGVTVNMKINGSLGGGGNEFVAVRGKVYADVSGNVNLAAAEGGSIKGGPGIGASNLAKTIVTPEGEVVRVGETITFGDPNGNSNIKAGGDLSVYTAGRIESSGFFRAGGNLTVSASSFGDVSYLQSGGTLTINNVGKPAHPQIAYFESVNGVEPTINNQPNDTVIFVDGRLAGGNLKILNQFGANEAFLVSTPELKSTQGIFGNPTFLHSDLDVANPMEVSAIDYMLQETPRLTLDKEFPAEVDSHVDSVVVPEKDSIQFGRSAKDETPTGATEEKVAETVSADGKVAMVK